MPGSLQILVTSFLVLSSFGRMIFFTLIFRFACLALLSKKVNKLLHNILVTLQPKTKLPKRDEKLIFLQNLAKGFFGDIWWLVCIQKIVKNSPSDRIWTSDLRISAVFPLQSSALPTELQRDWYIIEIPKPYLNSETRALWPIIPNFVQKFWGIFAFQNSQNVIQMYENLTQTLFQLKKRHLLVFCTTIGLFRMKLGLIHFG